MFVSVKFRPGDSRAYTYHYDGDAALKQGDLVQVDTHEGRKTVAVFETDLPEPPFACKPIAALAQESSSDE